MTIRSALGCTVALTLLVVACSSPEGGEGQHCYGNGTCNAGLECLSRLCVRPSTPDGSVDGATDALTDGTTADHVAPDAGTDAGGDAGPPPLSCTDFAAGFCANLQRCMPGYFAGRYGGAAACEREWLPDCMRRRAIPDTNGGIDDGACTSPTVSCGALNDYYTYFDTGPCAPRPGNRTVGQPCQISGQCAMGTTATGDPVQLNCLDGASMFCPTGTCQVPLPDGTPPDTCLVGGHDHCNHALGSACVFHFDATSGTSTTRSCERVVYGNEGDGCSTGSNRDCTFPLFCDTSSHTCTAPLPAGSLCDPSNDTCATYDLVACQPVGGGGMCVSQVYASIGAQCGLVGGVDNVCPDFALCMPGSPSTCVPRPTVGDACTTAPDDCDPISTCQSGTCVAITVTCT